MSEYYWADDDRTKHLYIPGMPGYGKTSLMANLVLDDLEFHDGPVIVIDPKGSRQGLVERVLPRIPKSLVDQTFYLSLADPVPIDIMGYRDQREKNYVRSDMITILKRFSFGNWGTTMQSVLNNLIPTLLEAQDATFLDIGRFLESKKRRDEILDQVSSDRRQYWRENEPSKSDSGPLASRMSNFKEPPLSTIVGGKRGEGLNIADIIDQNQILLVDTSPLSEDGLMLGALVMSRIQQAIFRRSPDKTHKRCHVYADEFQNFITSAFSEMLSQARSFNLSLCLANQHPGQIKEIRDDIIGTISNYLIFKLDGHHAEMLSSKIQEPVWNPTYIDKAAIKQRIDYLDKRRDRLSEYTDLTPQQQAKTDAESLEAYIEQTRLENELKAEPPQRPLGYLEQIPFLDIGEAIYVAANGMTSRVKTPAPPEPNARSYRAEIIENTSAQICLKRAGDKPPSHTGNNVPELKEDDDNITPGDKDDRPHRTVLPDQPKGKSPQGPR